MLARRRNANKKRGSPEKLQTPAMGKLIPFSPLLEKLMSYGRKKTCTISVEKGLI